MLQFRVGLLADGGALFTILAEKTGVIAIRVNVRANKNFNAINNLRKKTK